MNDELFESARQWTNHDSDTATSTRLLASLETAEKGDGAALAEMTTAVSGLLEFGTTGLRGEIGPDESRMNLAVVIHATAGLAACLKAQTGRAPRVIVDYGAHYDSVDFVRVATRVPSAAGRHAFALPVKNPTPLTSFAIRTLDADAGIMVTTSHNPAKGNGYKVCLGGTVVSDTGQGTQIVPPHNAQIAEAIVVCPLADKAPRDTLSIEDVDPHDDYVTTATALTHDSVEEKTALKITLTAIYGVDGTLTRRVPTEAGFTQVGLVAQQAGPDPDFPTISFPNPGEPGALGLAMEEAQRNASDLIIAVDPDADRYALVISDPNAEKRWCQFSGSEISSLLDEYITQSAPAGSVFANSIISSHLLERIAGEHGLGYQHTLTGFKWIARTPGVHFGREETIGLCPDPSQARDKDGISTSVVASSFFAGLRARNSNGQEELDRMTCAYGCYLTMPLTFRVDNLGLVIEGMNCLRPNPPKELAGSPVTEITDLSEGWGGLPGTNTITVLTGANDRVIARPSGTEPKLRYYLEVILPVEDRAEVPWKAARERLTLIRAGFVKAIGI